MTLSEIKYQVMFQTNNDMEDLGDFEPHIVDYINDGYDKLVKVYDNQHTGFGDTAYPRLMENEDAPLTPEWTHRYLADWATWLIYRNGNPQKQQRGYAFRESFEGLLSRIADEGGRAGETGGPYKRFRNIPV